MKKITSLLMMLCMFVGAVNAEVTKYYKPGERLTTFTEGQKVMFYNTCLPDGQDRTGFLIDNAGWFALNKQKPSAAPFFSEKVGVWTLQNVTNTEGVYTVNVKGANGYVGIGGKTNNADAQVLRFQEWTAADAGKKAGVDSENAAGTKVNNADISAEDKVWLVTNADQSTTWNGNQESFTTWSTGHPYAVYSVVEATTAELQAMLDAAKTAAVTELNDLKKLSDIYTTAESAISSVNAVVLENDDLETALNAIDALVVQVKLTADGKNAKFSNKSEDGRGGNYLGYDKANNRAAAVADGGDAAIWTIKTNADGTFKLYNWVNNHYLGAPADPTPVVAAEANAPSFKFVVTAENEVAIATGDKMVHIANHSDYKVINHWSTTDKASLWAVTVFPAIVVTHEQHEQASAAAATIMHLIQQAYGTVDASKYTSNAKESSEGSYEGLIDGQYNDPSFFHSTYNNNPGAYHYLQVEVPTAMKDFYFYFKKRQGNNNNRPTEIEIQGSADGQEFTTIKTINSGLPTDASVIEYVSEAVEATENVKFVRFVVKNTNNGAKDSGGQHPFFTFSEFYVLPATTDVTNLLTAYANFTSSSITSNDFATAAEALINAETTLSLANTKKEIAALIDANRDKVAEADVAPSLGQYPYENFVALETIYNSSSATQETLDLAISTFKKSKNLPVFTIDGVISYAAGKSIYDDPGNVNGKGNTLYFKATNVYDKTMWWALDMTETTVGVTEEVGIQNVGTGNGFWGVSSIKITETNENEGAGIADDGIFLFYTTGNDSPIHYQSDGQLICRYGDKGAASGSAHKFTYIGNTYDLAQLSDELITAAAELAAVNVPNYNFAEGVNNYNPATKLALDEAVAKRTEVLKKLSTADEIAAAKTQLQAAMAGVQMNQPVNGKFYRVRCAGSGMKYLQSTLDESNSEDIRLQVLSGATSDAATFCYVDGNLVSYTTGKSINAYRYDAVGTKSAVVFSNASNGKLGAYNINVAGRYIFGAQDNNMIDSGSGTPDARDGYTWWLEDVNEIPVTITEAGYATFYAPVALSLPAELTAYTVTVNGGWATLNAIEGNVIPANTGVVLGGANGEKASEDTYNLTVAESVDPISGNELLGTVAASYVTADAYALGLVDGEVGFYTATKNQQSNTSWLNNGFKAYLPKTQGASLALRFNFGGNTTAIESVLNNGVDANAPIYDLSGRRVNNAVKGGIYIQNGKKFIVK